MAAKEATDRTGSMNIMITKTPTSVSTPGTRVVSEATVASCTRSTSPTRHDDEFPASVLIVKTHGQDEQALVQRGTGIRADSLRGRAAEEGAEVAEECAESDEADDDRRRHSRERVRRESG